MNLGKRIKVPEGCDLVEAGALPVAFGTSHVALVHRANLSPGQVFFFTITILHWPMFAIIVTYFFYHQSWIQS